MPVEAHLFSDMQKSSMPPSFADLALGQGIRLVTHPVANQSLANFAVESVTAPRRLYDPKKVRIQATVMASGGAAGRRRVALLLNGREVASKPVDVSANGRATAEFIGLDAPYGMNRGEIRIDSADAFARRRSLSISRWSAPIRVPCCSYTRRATAAICSITGSAIESARDAAFTLQAASPDQAASLALSRYAFVVLSDVGEVPASFEQALRSYVAAGGSVLIALGPSSSARKRVPVSDEPIRETRYASRDAARFETVTTLDAAHPATRQAGNWAGVKFYRSVRVEPGTDRVLAKLSDDTPLLVEQQMGDGRVLMFASTFDNVANDFPLHAGFVPFVEETAHYLAGWTIVRPTSRSGSYLDLRTGREPSGAAIEVLESARRARHDARGIDARAQNIQLTEQGFYEVRRPNHHNELIAVNPDRRESDFDVIPPETLALWQNTGQGSRAQWPRGNGEGAQASGLLVVRHDPGPGAGRRGIVRGKSASRQSIKRRHESTQRTQRVSAAYRAPAAYAGRVARRGPGRLARRWHSPFWARCLPITLLFQPAACSRARLVLFLALAARPRRGFDRAAASFEPPQSRP